MGFPHLIQLSVNHPQFLQYHMNLLSLSGHVTDKRFHALMQYLQAASLQQHLGDPPQTECMMTHGFVSLTHWAGLREQGIYPLDPVATQMAYFLHSPSSLDMISSIRLWNWWIDLALLRSSLLGNMVWFFLQALSQAPY